MLAMPRLALAGCLLSSLAAPAQTPLPEGPGKELVASRCTQCHDLAQVTRAGYTREVWRDRVAMMINVGAQIPANEIGPIVDYLAQHFPERAMPKAVLLDGEARVAIDEWNVPTAGSRPHDPLAARDGSLWYTGQFANKLGRLDPKTGKIREYPLKTPGSGPHGLVEDKDGHIWFTANFKAYIGRLDPQTGDVKEYPLPAAARDPHTGVFDAKGVYWFTVQSANKVGRLDPASGEIKIVDSPTPKSRPYGIQVNSKGVPFFVEFGSNKVASIDPATMAIREYPLPDAQARPRRLAITSDDAIWYTDYARGFLGRLDPATGAVKEWPSPGGAKSYPYGIVEIKDVIWYSESGVQPNTIVRFDPKSGKFQAAPIPSGGGVVRNMSVMDDRHIAIACSGVNKVGIVAIR